MYPPIRVVETAIGTALTRERRVSVTRVFAGGCALAALVVLAGAAIEVFRLGTSDIGAAARVEHEVRLSFAAMTTDVERIGLAVAADPRAAKAIAADPATEETDRALFEAAADARRRVSAAPTVLAVTIYDANGTPRAWAGRASDLPPERTQAPGSVFVAPSPLGLRLFSLQPLTASSPDHARLGAVAVEHVLTAAPGSALLLAASEYVMPTARAAVALRLHREGTPGQPNSFAILTADGRPLLDASVATSDLAAARLRLRRGVVAIAVTIFACTMLLFAGPLLDARASARAAAGEWRLTLTIIAVILVGIGLLWLGFQISPWSVTAAHRTAFRLLLGGVAVAALAAAIVSAAVRLRVGLRSRRRWPDGHPVAFAAAQLLCGVTLAALLVGFEAVLGRAVDPAAVDLRHFSLHPWTAPRLASLAGVLLGHAGLLWLGAVTCVTALAPWRLPRDWSSRHGAAALLWLVPIVAVAGISVTRNWPVPASAVLLGAVACAGAGLLAPRLVTWYRRATVASRILALFMAFLLPALLVYPSVHFLAERAMRRLVEVQYAVEAMTHPETLQVRLQEALHEIDALPALPDLVAAAASPTATPRTDTAFRLWTQTVLARARLTSDVEIYDRQGAPVSRFALNVPEYTNAAQTPERLRGCEWEVFGEALLFGGAQERNTLHAQRSVCQDGQPIATIVVHVVFDYRTLPFIRSQSAYLDAFGASDGNDVLEAPPAGEVEFTVYGWGLTTIYTSGGDAWPLDEATFARVYRSRDPFWTVLRTGNRSANVYFSNNRQGIYAVGYRRAGAFDHLVRLAELTTLAAVAYVVVLVGNVLFARLARMRPRSGRSLLREIRASFYRKLFLAFVLASIFPVLILAVVIRTYFAGLLLADIRGEASRTAAVAQRVIEESDALLRRGAEGITTPFVGDDVMVWISQLIDQDVNVYVQANLAATSERDLFASGLLPTRTPDEVYRAIVLQRLPSVVAEDRIGSIPFLLAAAPVRTGGQNAMLTVPLAFRQHEVEREIDELDRGVHLAALFFILLGAAIGLSMAERIADPIRQLTRATGRIARGDFDARIAVRSSDELRRLVDAFNGMAAELKAQRDQLERTHRLEAWAEMARQVAHEIKNPLTPIQLSAEHLQRVHADRGAPLGPVLEGCVTSILGQVRLLRQIAAEFSSFASSPTARRAAADPVQLVNDVVEPYRVGLQGRIDIFNEVTESLPLVVVDRTLVARALVNIVENALHAMPGPGSLRVTSAVGDRTVALRVEDSGFGMDAEALERVFEPYFSTKTTGTGLGLPIARRNIELSGGTIAVESEKGRGTAVTINLPTE
ncbi:MAG: ATP-binding protein [Vicinamibacterales bacterium]